MASKVIQAAGLVVYRQVNAKIQYLLLQHRPNSWDSSQHWTPPKGHVDPGETDLKKTAWRETIEESGLDETQLELIEGFEQTLKYEVKGKPKTVVYWLAKVRNPATVTVKISSEHQTYDWFELDVAVVKAAYLDLIGLLRNAETFITTKSHV